MTPENKQSRQERETPTGTSEPGEGATTAKGNPASDLPLANHDDVPIPMAIGRKRVQNNSHWRPEGDWTWGRYRTHLVIHTDNKHNTLSYSPSLIDPDQNCGCRTKGLHRNNDTCGPRRMFTLDADYLVEAGDPNGEILEKRLRDSGLESLLHDTYSSKNDAVRLRVAVLADEEVGPDEHGHIARVLMQQLSGGEGITTWTTVEDGKERTHERWGPFDLSCDQHSRFMYFQTLPDGAGDGYREHFEGEMLPVGIYLDTPDPKPPVEATDFTAVAVGAAASPEHVQEALRLLDVYAKVVARSGKGVRNDNLSKYLRRLYRMALGGCLDREHVAKVMAEAARESGLGDDEIDGMLAKKWDHAMDAGALQPEVRPNVEDVFTVEAESDSLCSWEGCDKPRARGASWDGPETEGVLWDFCAEHQKANLDRRVVNPSPVSTYLPEAFWSARPEFGLIRQWAKARMAPPDATFGCLVVRVLASVDPEYVLPAYVGGIGSLNFIAGIVAPSGGGKGAAEGAAEAALDLIGFGPKERQVGTGEGLLHAFGKKTKETGERTFIHTRRVLFSVPEVDVLSKLMTRNGATLGPVLRSAWSGETLGFGNANPQNSLEIPKHGYRFAMTVGIQPGRGDALLNDDEVAGGTPQRFVWFNGVDPDPDMAAKDPEERIKFDVPDEKGEGFIEITTDDVVRDDIRRARMMNLRGDKDAIDGHAMFSREKLAAAMALLDGRKHIDAEDWRLAGMVMRTSDAVRASVGVELAKKAKERSIAQGKAAGVVEVAKDRVVDANRSLAATKAIKVKVKNLGGKAVWNDVRRGIRANHREFFEEAVSSLEKAGVIRVDKVANRNGVEAVWLALLDD